MHTLHPETTASQRNQAIDALANPSQEWDLLVIGGGATGLGIALDAVSRGYKVALVEQADFAKGTSSRSTKLVHGGVRYLAQGDVKMVREASIERGILHRNAPHLVKDQTFLVPVYSWWDRLKYTIGLKLYDRIAGKLRLGPSVFISRKEAIEKLPGIKTKQLKGAVLYHDGQFDDSRLAINLAQTIIEQGGTCVNYMKVVGLRKNKQGRLDGATVCDTETGISYQVATKAVVNATGVFVDDILQMDDPSRDKSVCVSQGVHLVMDKHFFPSTDALMIPETSDGRVLFAVPWHEKVVLGTTDTPIENASLEPQALEKEIDFILATAGAYFNSKPRRKDVLSVFAGLRPLAAPAKGEQKTKEISRSHKIIVSSSKLFSMLGGKWTTYRKMGEDMLNCIEKELGWKARQSETANMMIHGHNKTRNWSDPLYYYGTDAVKIRSMMNGDANEWLSVKLNIHKTQVYWAVEHEMARTLEDFLCRRTRALLLDAREAKRIAAAVASLMAEALGKNTEWKNEQVRSFEQLADQYLLH